MRIRSAAERRKSGFTVLELLIASSIFSVMMVSVAALFMSAEQGYEFTLNTYNLETSTAKATEMILEELKSAQILAIETHDQHRACLIYQVPIDWDDDGDVIDDNGNVEWGATWSDYEPNNPENLLNHVYVLWLKPETEWSRNYSEAEYAQNIDYNGDGDQYDNFLRGTLVLDLYTSTADLFSGSNDEFLAFAPFDPWAEPLSSRVRTRDIARNLANTEWVDWNWIGPNPATIDSESESYFDLDGDGEGDVLFGGTISSKKMTRLDVRIGAFVRDTHNQPMRKIRTVSVELRNTASENTRLYRYAQKYN